MYLRYLSYCLLKGWIDQGSLLVKGRFKGPIGGTTYKGHSLSRVECIYGAFPQQGGGRFSLQRCCTCHVSTAKSGRDRDWAVLGHSHLSVLLCWGTETPKRVPASLSYTRRPLIGWPNRPMRQGANNKQTQYRQGISGQWRKLCLLKEMLRKSLLSSCIYLLGNVFGCYYQTNTDWTDLHPPVEMRHVIVEGLWRGVPVFLRGRVCAAGCSSPPVPADQRLPQKDIHSKKGPAGVYSAGQGPALLRLPRPRSHWGPRSGGRGRRRPEKECLQ